MLSKLAPYRKFLVALGGAVVSAVIAAVASGDAKTVGQIVAAGLAAIGVFLAKNEAPEVQQ